MSHYNEESFNNILPTSVSLSSIQSLCDLLQELPLPTSLYQQQSIINNISYNNVINSNSFGLIQSSLQAVKHHVNELQFINNNDVDIQINTNESSLITQFRRQHCFDEGYNNHNNTIEELNNLKPSLEQQLEDDTTQMVINDLINDDYSSLGDRIKQNKRNAACISNRQEMRQENRIDNRYENRNDGKNENKIESKNDRCDMKQYENRQYENKQYENKQYENRHEVKHEMKHHEMKHHENKHHENKHHENKHHENKHKVHNDDYKNQNDSYEEKIEKKRKIDKQTSLEGLLDEILSTKDEVSPIDIEYLPNLINLISKMKHNRTLNQVSVGKLTELQNMITTQLCIWTANLESHFHHCCDLCLISLLIMTSDNMSQSVYHEECLEAIFNFISSSLSSIIAVSSSTTKKSPKKKQPEQLVVTSFATKKQLQRWSELLLLIKQLLEIKQNGLNDSLIISLTRLSFAAFFLNDNELQNNAIHLIDLIFSFYSKHQNAILKDLLNEIPRAPVSKKHQFDSTTSMFTALILRLTQQLFVDKNEYDKSILTISSFIHSFMRSCCGLSSHSNNQVVSVSNEHDLRAIFDSMVTDISKSMYRPEWPGAKILCHIIIKICVKNLSTNKDKSKNINLQLKLSSIDQLATICCQLSNDIAMKEKLINEIYSSLKNISPLKSTKTAINEDELLNESFYHFFRYLKDQKMKVQRKNFLLMWSREFDEKKFEMMTKNDKIGNEDEIIDEETASNIIKYYDLVHSNQTQPLFDHSLSYLTASLSLTSNTTQRSRAMRALSSILSTSPPELATQLLARNDLQLAMKSALLDASTSVREATIDLIGKFMLTSKQTILLDKYIGLICDRILDNGVSVRKRVIKIIREVCAQYNDYAKIDELCFAVLKRINDDEEGIRKLVIETFTNMWFKGNIDIKTKVNSLLSVVGHVVLKQNVDLLTTLFDYIFKETKDEIHESSKSIVDYIINEIINDDDKLKLVSAMTILWLFSKSSPLLLIDHLSILQPFLSLPFLVQSDVLLRIRVLSIIERAILHITNPSDSLLTQFEMDLAKNMLMCPLKVLPNCVSCLSAIIHKHTQNNNLVNELFTKCSQYLTNQAKKPNLVRSLLICGLLAKHFQFGDHRRLTLTSRLHSLLLMNTDIEINKNIITSLGYLCHGAPQTMLEEETKNLYLNILNNYNDTIGHNGDTNNGHNDQSSNNSDGKVEYIISVLNSLCQYLSQKEEQNEAASKQTKWEQISLKTISDNNDDQIQSSIIQTYLSSILGCTLSNQLIIRRAAVSLVHVIHSAGLVHPLQLVPHLVAMSTDDDPSIRTRVDHVLNDIEKRYHGFVGMKTKPSILLSFELNGQSRGYRKDVNGQPLSRLATLYSVVTHNRQARRAFLQTFLKSLYDDEQMNVFNYPLSSYVADNLVFFPYQFADEVLFLLHSFETTMSIVSSHVYALFKEILLLQDDDNDEEFTNLIHGDIHYNIDLSRLESLTGSLRIVYLITWLKQLFKELYSLSEAKCQEYSPHENVKVWDKPIHRKQFDVGHLESLMKYPTPNYNETNVKVQELVQEYSRFKSTSISGVLPEMHSPAAIIAIKLENKKIQNESAEHQHLSDEEQRRLLEEIQKSSCIVKLNKIDIEKKKHEKELRKKEKKKKKKHKRQRVIIESDEDEESDDNDNEEDGDYDYDDN